VIPSKGWNCSSGPIEKDSLNRQICLTLLKGCSLLNRVYYNKFKEEATRPYVTNWERRMASSKFLSYESTETTERGR
jgi:hypothetical protein